MDESLPKSRLYPAVTALLLGLAICTPVLVPQTMEAKRFYSNGHWETTLASSAPSPV